MDLKQFLSYHEKAHFLQENPGAQCGDELMDKVPIYDTVHRRNAGFSKVLEDLDDDYTFRSRPLTERMLLYYIHRLTGSGASFETDHGYRNNRIKDAHELCRNSKEIVEFFCDHPGPIFTSIGNQIPPFPKPMGSERAYQGYFWRYLRDLVEELCSMLTAERLRCSILEATDFIFKWHRYRQLKRFAFVQTAWAMDLAEYESTLVNPRSDVHLGANAIRAMKIIFPDTPKKHYDGLMRKLISESGVESYPMDMEDVLCDFIRYINFYVPKSYRDRFDPDHPLL